MTIERQTGDRLARGVQRIEGATDTQTPRRRVHPHRVQVHGPGFSLPADAEGDADPDPVFHSGEERLVGGTGPPRRPRPPGLLVFLDFLGAGGTEGLGRIEQRAQAQVPQPLPVGCLSAQSDA